MPLGSFLDSLPTMLYVCAHVLFLVVGIWAAKKAKENKAKFASAFWLYVASADRHPHLLRRSVHNEDGGPAGADTHGYYGDFDCHEEA